MGEATDWDAEASNILRSELKRRGMTYRDLTECLVAIGVEEKEANVRNKIGRGRFTAAFFLQCLTAVGSDRLRVD